MHPKDLLIEDFTYELPAERIAKYPLEERDSSKLLVFDQTKIQTDVYKNLHHFLPPGCLLMFNNTRVVEARLLFRKPSGGVIEIFCLEPADRYPDITTAMLQKGMVWWKCLVGGASKWKNGMRLEKQLKHDGETITLTATIAERLADCFVIKLEWLPGELAFSDVLHLAGLVPLPPYLHRAVEATDKERYQTIYAATDGSVAAPTAGLHFTPVIFEQLAAKTIQHDFVTLHVGAGTFKPVKSAKIEQHDMHAEFIEVTTTNINQLLHQIDETIVAVGTTSLRTIESLYWMGLKVHRNPLIEMEDLVVQQWEPYEQEPDLPATRIALTALLKWMEVKKINKLFTKTQILIAPGYTLRVAGALITNFHQPQSTLLLLIAAFTGDKWKQIYQYAMDNDFRFLSYGDGCLLFAPARK